jgi:hypothetical protein
MGGGVGCEKITRPATIISVLSMQETAKEDKFCIV